MLKLTDIEIKVMDHFHIVPNNFDGEGSLPTRREIDTWLTKSGLQPVRLKTCGKIVLASLRKKLWDQFEPDSISIEDTATWVLSHYFSLEELRVMRPEDAEKFLQNWKYFFGFRKCDGWGDTYIHNAMRALRGEIVLDEKSKDYFYIEKK